MLFGQYLRGGMSGVIDHQHPVIDGVDDIIGQKGRRSIIIQIAFEGIGHGFGDQGSGFFVHGFKVGLIQVFGTRSLVIGNQQQIILPGLGVDRAFIGDDFSDHDRRLAGIGCGQASNVHVGHRIVPAEGHKPLIGNRLSFVVGIDTVGGQIGGCIVFVPVVFRIVGAVAHQQHMPGCRWRPIAVGIGQKVFDGMRALDAEAEFIVNVFDVGHKHPKALSLSKGHKIIQPLVSIPADIPADIAVGDEDIVGAVGGMGQVCRSILDQPHRDVDHIGAEHQIGVTVGCWLKLK